MQRLVLWRILWERALADLVASDDGQPCLKLNLRSLQKCPQDPSRLLWVGRQEAEIDHPWRCRLATPVDQLPEVSVKSEEVPILGPCQGEHGPIGRPGHVTRHMSNVMPRCPEAKDRGFREVFIRQETDHATPRSTE